jgi:cell wall-associated NlpC family hydrolase
VTDRRLTPSNGRVAHVSLQGHVLAKRYTEGDQARVTQPVADLLAEPDGRRDRQVILGDHLLVLEIRDDFAFVQSAKDGYCGYVAASALGPARPQTHWVSAPATHLYAAADLKSADQARLTLGSHLCLTAAEHGAFLETIDGLFVPHTHVRPLGDWATDAVAIAESLIGTPYLWGGNSRDGIDCSGLVQASFMACGTACPADSDLQEAALGFPLAPGAAYRRGDLFCWNGHVALAVGGGRLIHANAHHMAVAYEGIAEAIDRIESHGGGGLQAVKRL